MNYWMEGVIQQSGGNLILDIIHAVIGMLVLKNVYGEILVCVVGEKHTF